MVNSGMLICSFYLKKRFQRGEEELLPLNSEYEFIDEDDIQHHFENALDIIKRFCDISVEGTDDEKAMKLFSVAADSAQIHNEPAYSALSFVINSGSYGIDSEITDRKTGKVRYKCSEDDAPVKKFRCVVFIPKDTKRVQVAKGIFVFQSLGNFGVKSITIKNLKVFCAKLGLTLETRSVSVRMFIEKLIEKGSLYKVTLIRDRVSPDGSDTMLVSTGREERSYIRPHFRANWIEKFLNAVDGAKETELLEVDDTMYEDITVTFKLGKKYRTVRLTEIDRFSVVEDIPEHIVKKGKIDGNCIVQYMLETATAYAQKMVFAVATEV